MKHLFKKIKHFGLFWMQAWWVRGYTAFVALFFYIHISYGTEVTPAHSPTSVPNIHTAKNSLREVENAFASIFPAFIEGWGDYAKIFPQELSKDILLWAASGSVNRGLNSECVYLCEKYGREARVGRCIYPENEHMRRASF